MKLKRLQYIFGIIFILGLLNVSCVEELKKDIDYNPISEGEGYISMRIKAGDGDALAFTRSEEITGNIDELKIHSVRVVLYDGQDPNDATCKVEYAFEFDITTPTGWNNLNNLNDWVKGESPSLGNTEDGVITPGGDHLYNPGSRTDFQFITFAQRVEKKPYKMLVIINGEDASASPLSIYNVTRKGHFLSDVKAAISAEVNPLDGSLKGGKGIVMTNHQGLVEVPIDKLKENAQDSHDDPVYVNVDRMVAKVTVKHADDFIYPAGIVKGSETWALDITNKKAYWMREKTDGEIQQSGMTYLYAKDPNYSLLTDKSDKESNFNYLYTTTNNGFTSLSPDKVKNEFKEYEYAFENTIPSETKSGNADFADQTTSIIVGYKYVPSGFSAGDDFYVFNNRVISQADMTKYQDPLDTSQMPQGLEDLKAAIKLVLNMNIYKLDGSSKTFFETEGIRFCPEGQIYYSFPIRHFENGTLGYYGVVRNNIYDITIKSLNPPDLPGPYLSADIHIQPWAERSQGSTIGIVMNEAKFTSIKVYYTSYSDGHNLYKYWWANNHGMTSFNYGDNIDSKYPGLPAFRQIRVPVGTSLPTGYDAIKIDMTDAKYGYHRYSHSYPTDGIIADEDENANVINLYYTNTYAGVAFLASWTVHFADRATGEILSVQSLYNTEVEVVNYYDDKGSLAYHYDAIRLTTYRDTNGDGALFLRDPVLTHGLILRNANNDEYEVTSTVRRIAVRQLEPGGIAIVDNYGPDPIIANWQINKPTFVIMCDKK